MAILVVENMVVSNAAFLFIDRNSTAWVLSLVSMFIGIGIWYGIRGFLQSKPDEDDDFNF